MSDTADDDDWMPCMTLMLQAADETPEGEEELRQYVDSRIGPGRPTYTVMATVLGQFTWLKQVGTVSAGIGSVCGYGGDGVLAWTGPSPPSAQLVSHLSQWCLAYQQMQSAERPPLHMLAFEAQGIALALRLKGELGESAQVMYRDAGGDPSVSNRSGSSVEIVAGTVVGMS